MSGIPWRAWLHAAIQLGVAPHQFWRLSVVEWMALLSAADHAALSRADLAQLMNAFPDVLIKRETKHG